MRSTRFVWLAAVTLLAAGVCAACGTIAIAQADSGLDSAMAAAAAKPTVAVPGPTSTTDLSGAPRATTGPQTVPVTRGSIANVLTVDGVVAPQEQTPLTYQWKAMIDSVNVKSGQSVKEGDALIDFNTGDIPKTLEDARVRLQSSQVQLAQAQPRQQSAAQRVLNDQPQKRQAVADAEAGLQAAQANLTAVQAGH